MKGLPSLVIVTTVVLLSLTVCGFGQGDGGRDQPCTGVYGPVTLTDATCSETLLTGCETVEFTPTVTCEFTLTVTINCTGNCDSDECQASAKVSYGGGDVAGWFHNGAAPGCKYTSASFTLTAGVLYKLYVCLNAHNPPNCDGCAAHGCTAWAQVSQVP
jgi:hypothetical protein